jgi:DNA polymerase III subunit beta
VLRMVATDGHRMAIIEGELQSEGSRNVLIPTRALHFLKKLLALSGKDDVTEFRQDDTHLYFSLGKRKMMLRKLAGQFPQYEAVIPKDLKKSATLESPLFHAALRRVALMADERSRAMRFTLSNGQLQMESRGGDMGDGFDQVMAEAVGLVDGEKIEIGFNHSYISDFLSVVSPAKVRLELKDGESAALMVVVPDAEEKAPLSYRYVCMPLRV